MSAILTHKQIRARLIFCNVAELLFYGGWMANLQHHFKQGTGYMPIFLLTWLPFIVSFIWLPLRKKYRSSRPRLLMNGSRYNFAIVWGGLIAILISGVGVAIWGTSLFQFVFLMVLGVLLMLFLGVELIYLIGGVIEESSANPNT